LAAGETGILAQIDVQEGTRVAAGQLVAQLDTVILERTLEIARQRSVSVGALQAANAELNLRRKQLEQLQPLRDRGHATQRELERAETDVQIAAARVAIAEEELMLQRLECKRIEAQIERRQIRSPIAGVVSEVFREVGESFLANDPRVLTIVQIDRLRAKFSVSANQSRQLTRGQKVFLSFPEHGGQAQAVVESIAPVMDAKSGTVQVTVALDNPNGQLVSGMRCLLAIDGPLRDEKREESSPRKTRYTSAPGPR
jgi:RND family efflux transporter MFP subunit